MLQAGEDQVNSGGFDAGVAQHIRQLHDIFTCVIENRGKQMPQVVGEHLGGHHPRRFAQALHLPPDLLSRQADSGGVAE